MNSFSRNSGYSLLELLVILAVVGILLTILFGSVGTQIQQSKLREAVSQVAADIEKARSASFRSSKSTAIEVANDGRSYTLIFDADARRPVQTEKRPLPDGITLSVSYPNNANRIIKKFGYTAPYGTITATGLRVSLTSVRINNPKTFYLVGVTGKVTQ